MNCGEIRHCGETAVYGQGTTPTIANTSQYDVLH